jgi:hypothetical protein
LKRHARAVTAWLMVIRGRRAARRVWSRRA